MKRKIKRFSNGGMDDYDSSDDAKNLMAAAARESAEANAPKTASTPAAEPLKMASFGEAFKEARNRGDKTFEYMGKKYTTEMAGAKKSTASKTPASPSSGSMDRSSVASRKPGLFTKLVEMARNPSNPRLRRERASMQEIDSNFKKGGSVSSASKRADGCAMRGKTRGKMV